MSGGGDIITLIRYVAFLPSSLSINCPRDKCIFGIERWIMFLYVIKKLKIPLLITYWKISLSVLVIGTLGDLSLQYSTLRTSLKFTIKRFIFQFPYDFKWINRLYLKEIFELLYHLAIKLENDSGRTDLWFVHLIISWTAVVEFHFFDCSHPPRS